MPFLVNPSLLTPAGGGGGGTYSAAVLAQPTLLAYYRLGETSGTTMADSSGNGRDGSYNSTVASVAGLQSGDADPATTSTGFISSADWMGTPGLALECIVKSSGAGSNEGIVTRFESGHDFIVWRNVAGNLAVRFYNTSDVSVDLDSGIAPVTGTKYHIVASYSSGDAWLMVNGTVVASSSALTGNLQQNFNSIEIGTYSNNTFSFAGVKDEVAIYSALSQADAAAHAALV